MNPVLVATFYLFVSIDDCEKLRAALFDYCCAQQILGTILLADEGINGTICGEPQSVHCVLDWIRSDDRFEALTAKFSHAQAMTFKRLKVKIKPEIVKLGMPEINAATMAGERVGPARWNQLLADPEVVVIDTRNDFEVAIGTFPGAVNPQTRNFRDLPAWVEHNRDLLKKPKVAMFCTGGIRCEKSTSLLKAQGYEHVYHLDGGILKYLETVAQSENQWQGECFVFDERVSVDSALRPGTYNQCTGCGVAVSKPATRCECCDQARRTTGV